MVVDFTRKEIINAIKQIDDNPKIKTGRHSSTYDLIYNKKKISSYFGFVISK
ncbi:hypothetical protein SAMN05216556_13914 [Aequorivita viscosa]|uniref:Uncharacterized protein n=1 Tax=Aequorivita viscosa TaxID=797419 RepID=A0A1M6P3X1_9FLAO|nr:hypothetical protein SAMN05216556_13914 [Aequorivita viscosa]SHK02593.1 hypothetical protein SAMN04487908_1425 [Aequorivita viscosa]